MDTGTTKMIARKEDGIGWMIFNQPDKLNAVSYDMWLAVPRIIADYEADPGVRVIVLAGAGDKAFVSGADISEFEQKRGTADAIKVYNEAGDHANAALINAAKPTIAMIRGYCIGGGLGIALTTDLRICGDTSTFAVPAAKLGLGYAYGGIKRLADVVGPSFAKEIFYTARQFTAEEARVMGLVNRIVPVAELEAYVRKYAATIAANAPLTVKAAKMAINAAMKDPDRRDLARVQEAVDVCFASDDYKEGRRAFMEKRKPAFKGR
ncbi:enoyl-CoA hydratase [Vineibacter terrae]|uniref:enoyl-CoA hydratase n=1 Tax=Vineibacter terrae TaxID=2586908 RepID=UPI002E3104CF|nr:enoyl-CoA hydratase [Vineibacter terrae]HEX2885015.1 enoyl-CoA hydratase [Vineibacter terrae]